MTDISIGTQLPALTLPAINRTTLALFAGASGDHNPIHIDIDFAKRAGMDDVFAHGMLSMAYLGRLLTNWQPQSKLRKFETKFTAITQLRDVITCSGEVIDVFEYNNEPCAKVAIQAAKDDGTKTLVGEAVVAI
ncbi:MaoC family dehydratase [Thalassotalea sp. LPB0316]|uniref:MaoC family dehydratase n=1 Tax=Thalassotalea sp. LPB0316 TaxID=2769490 RepID=UPI001D04341D|nr:MaoC family dehydratase [Thalassotalea sp. LPB0316]